MTVSTASPELVSVMDDSPRRVQKLNKPRKQERSKGDVPFAILNYLGFTLFAILCAYPFWYLIVNSLSRNDLSALGQVRLFPIGFHLQNYAHVVSIPGLGQSAFISIARTVVGTFCTVMASAYLGFMFTQEQMWHRKFWYRFMVITMYFNAGLIPMYITMHTIGLTNSFWVYILPAIVQPFNIILVKTFVESLPKSLQEAAAMDGAGPLRTFFQVILPNMTPILATIAIFAGVGQWNAFQDTLIFITDQRLWPLQFRLWMVINQAASLAQAAQQGGIGAVAGAATRQTSTSIQMTVAVVVVLPILFIYPLFQRHFVKGIMLGAVKG